MTEFIIFAFYLTISTFLLVTVPVMLLPGMKFIRKLLIIFIAFLIIVPGGLALYAWLGAPQMGAL